MWYKAPIELTIPDLDSRAPWYRQAFITRRRAIQCPPRTNVVQNDEHRRRLHFFDHGCGLHDGAIDAFERQTPATDISTQFVVEYPSGHPILQWADRRLLLAVSELDLRGMLSFDLDAILGTENLQLSKAEQDARTAVARIDAYRMIQRRAADLGTRSKIGCHTFRATGITAYLEAGGTLENAQAMAAHESPRTTKLYDRTGDEITLDEIERITI